MLTATKIETQNVSRSPLTTPVAFIVFNRPDFTQRVFNRIAEVKPQTLLLIADGPRTEEEAKTCDQVRNIISQVDWDCRVLKNFSDINLGCRHRPASGLDWVFSLVNEAIILEDDCLPSHSFFYYSQALLDYYRDDKRIAMIGGNNFQFGIKRTEDSYYFSRHPGTWGWATWKRAWQYYDQDMKTWPAFKEADKMRWIFENPAEQQFFEPFFQQCYENKLDAWDFIWFYSYLSQNGLCVEPAVNLVSNIGWGPVATHTFDPASRFSNVPPGEIWEIKHPQQVLRHVDADNYYFKVLIG
ncbi:MAG: glycosyltransferase family 2 protein [Verrucomicrobia bacterium]|nr:glycosyltransferase family 2 protein [Verrucomicrobiota bacterium]